MAAKGAQLVSMHSCNDVQKQQTKTLLLSAAAAAATATTDCSYFSFTKRNETTDKTYLKNVLLRVGLRPSDPSARPSGNR
jgi:hypothetical protein